MRTHKYRAWDKQENKMILPSELDDHEFEWLFMRLNGELWHESTKEENRLILMQFTGLKDSKNKDIYEGDIVEYDNRFNEKDKLSKSVVQWNNGYLVSEIAGMGTSKCFKVIGNIYQNPKLLT